MISALEFAVHTFPRKHDLTTNSNYSVIHAENVKGQKHEHRDPEREAAAQPHGVRRPLQESGRAWPWLREGKRFLSSTLQKKLAKFSLNLCTFATLNELTNRPLFVLSECNKRNWTEKQNIQNTDILHKTETEHVKSHRSEIYWT